jgi:hypothetical protein
MTRLRIESEPSILCPQVFVSNRSGSREHCLYGFSGKPRDAASVVTLPILTIPYKPSVKRMNIPDIFPMPIDRTRTLQHHRMTAVVWTWLLLLT